MKLDHALVKGIQLMEDSILSEVLEGRDFLQELRVQRLHWKASAAYTNNKNIKFQLAPADKNYISQTLILACGKDTEHPKQMALTLSIHANVFSRNPLLYLDLLNTKHSKWSSALYQLIDELQAGYLKLRGEP